MKLPPRNLALKPLVVKDKPVLALDTGFEADSVEGMRLVKASRGSGWLYSGGVLRPWVTRGVLQESKRLLVWGDLEPIPEGTTPELWPQDGPEGKDYLKAFVLAWAARAADPEPLAGFTPSSVVPLRTADGWAFAFLPPELRGVLDSLQPLRDRLAWDHFRHPDASGAASWALTSAALAWNLGEGTLPWAQDEEAHLRQEVRDLKKTLSQDELPEGPDAESLNLWFDSLTGRIGTEAVSRWTAWAKGSPSWTGSGASRGQRREAAASRRSRRRSGAAFWRSKGTVTTVIASAAALVLVVVGSVVWGILKPDPTDQWTPDQVVRGYYQGINTLDADQMRKITAFDKGRQPELGRDQDEVSNLFVIRQVRTAYEHQSPVVEAQAWEAAGRPALSGGQILYGTSGLEVTAKERSWTVRYRKWVSESTEGGVPTAVGASVVDELGLIKTSRGWKISNLHRDRQPLP